MSTYDEDVEDEFDEFENTANVHDLSLSDYAEWLEAVIATAQMRLASAREDMGG